MCASMQNIYLRINNDGDLCMGEHERAVGLSIDKVKCAGEIMENCGKHRNEIKRLQNFESS